MSDRPGIYVDRDGRLQYDRRDPEHTNIRYDWDRLERNLRDIIRGCLERAEAAEREFHEGGEVVGGPVCELERRN